MRWLALLSLLLLAACNDNGGSSTPQQPNPSDQQFTAFYSRDVRVCDDFEFGEPHYCLKLMPAGIGQVATITFTVSGQLYPVDVSMNPAGTPANLRIMVMRRGDNMTCAGAYQGYRQWGSHAEPLTPGQHTLSVQLAPENFTDCYGQHNDLAGVLQNLYGIGFSFGGNDAGHGVKAYGQGHFHLDSFTVQ